MKLNAFSLLIASVLSASSCTITKKMQSNVTASQVTDLQYFQPISYISLIESGNKAKYNDTISATSAALLETIIGNFKAEIPVTGRISASDTATRNKLEKEAEFLCIVADRKRSIVNLHLTPVIDSLLKATGKRFGLITVATGFTRAKGNYGKQVAKGAGMAILTLGMFYQNPIKANSTVYVVIVDAKENNVAFFRKSYLQDKSPLNETTVTGQIQKIFAGYFFRD